MTITTTEAYKIEGGNHGAYTHATNKSDLLAITAPAVVVSLRCRYRPDQVQSYIASFSMRDALATDPAL